jgi:hypothetical protein
LKIAKFCRKIAYECLKLAGIAAKEIVKDLMAGITDEAHPDGAG